MTREFSIIHLSDLHFGRIHPATLEHLDHFLKQRKDEIGLAILTGDLTQRARKQEFLAAKSFLESLPAPLFLVPGNHDVPLYNLFLRFIAPYKKFLNYLGPFAKSFYEDDRVIVCGLWTTNNFTVKTGKLRKEDLALVEEKFRTASPEKLKIIASHHPLTPQELRELVKHGPHFLMWGHEHQSGIFPLHPEKKSPLIMASGTTTSSRTRNEANSFNYLTIRGNECVTEVFRHSKLLGAFEVIDRKTFPLAFT